MINVNNFISCLYILEYLRDECGASEMTPDEIDILREAHSIVQEHREELPEHLLES